MRIKILHFKFKERCSGLFNRLMFVFLFSIFGLTGMNGQSMKILFNDGAESVYSLNQLESITLPKKGFRYVNQSNRSSVLLSTTDVRRITFSNSTDLPLINTKKQNNISFFPNPVVDFLNIQISGEKLHLDKIEIISSSGIVLHTEVFNSETDKYQINVSYLSPGIYFGRIKMGDSVEILKFYKK